MNAIIFCAGIGKRFQPISFTCPKPLVPLNGVPIVEQTLQMLRANGNVDRITLVLGYMAEKFEYLKEKYNVETVFNPRYATHNTHSSLMCVTDRLDGSLLIDGDVVFLRDVLSRIQPGKSQFVVQPTALGLEWEVFSDETGRIGRVEKWTPHGYSMCGLSYWEGEAARKLAAELPNSDPDHYWEESVLRILPTTAIYATKVHEPFLQETDCIKDAMDYGLITHEEIAVLSSVDFKPVRLKGLTNSTWQIRDPEGVMRCLRIPGHGTDAYIQRSEEPQLVALMEHLKITPETHFYPGGLKTTRFLNKHRVATVADFEPQFLGKLAELLHKLHTIKYTSEAPLAPMLIMDQILKFEKLSGKQADPEQREWLLTKAEEFDAEPCVLCHRDLALENILVAGDHGADMHIIDFEYGGFAHPVWEFASFILESGMDDASRAVFAKACGLTTPAGMRRLFEMEILVDYVWGMWGFVQSYFDYSDIKLKRMARKLKEAMSWS